MKATFNSILAVTYLSFTPHAQIQAKSNTTIIGDMRVLGVSLLIYG